MKIVEVESFLLGDAHLLRIHTDEGISGLGQSACWGYPAATDKVIDYFVPYLIGKDPLDIEKHWHHLYRMGPFRGSILMAAISAVDIALWDIKGKFLGVPIWQLLGGRARDKVRVYELVEGGGPDKLRADIAKAIAKGFSAVKISPLPPDYKNLSHVALVNGIHRQMTAAREEAGEHDLIIEFGRTLSATQALSLINIVGEYNPLFVEDPIQIDSIHEQARIASRTSVPMGHGERLHSIWEFRELLEQGGPQYVRPDIGLAGGITHCKKIAAVADSFHANVCTHNCLGPVLTAASVHLDVSIPNFRIQEYYTVQDEGPASAGYTSACVRDGAFIPAPQAPGLGVELDIEKASGYRYLPRQLHEIVPGNDGFPGSI